ncbi:Uma2 family endonuclease [Streptomyces sp. NPDC007896]|uniref:Uma2 family endonuclease n=1 Tax=unclassified Streptomyces TaxID=2593676 RepID=UPI0036E72E0C
MTVVENDRIAMATINEQTLDELFAQMIVPEGFKAEIVEGAIYMSPQRDVHWETILLIVEMLRDHFKRRAKVLSDVRVDFPGHLNGFCPDVAKLRDGSEKDAEGRWRYQDVEFIAEVISKDTARNDYGPKKTAYALAEVPVYLIADPYQGRCHVYTQPKDGEYVTETTVSFGGDVDLTATLGLTLKTDEFPRD